MQSIPTPRSRRGVAGAVLAVCALGATLFVVGLVTANRRQRPEPPGVTSTTTGAGVTSTTTGALAQHPRFLGDAPPTTHVDLEAVAFDICQGHVRTRLRSGPTAKFADFSRGNGQVKVTTLRTAQFRVTSWVQAQTQAGATFRNTYDCVVTKDATSWRLDHLTIS